MPYHLDQIDPAKTVMIVVDMQNDFVARGAKLQSAAAAAMVPKLASTLNFCRFELPKPSTPRQRPVLSLTASIGGEPRPLL